MVPSKFIHSVLPNNVGGFPGHGLPSILGAIAAMLLGLIISEYLIVCAQVRVLRMIERFVVGMAC